MARKTLAALFSISRFSVLMALSIYSVSSFAGFDGELGFESRYFLESGLGGQAQFQPSVRSELEFSESSSVGDFSVVLFGRYDQEDAERTHVDIREALWTYVGDSWELKTGISKVFWGVTESRHLVDVINQSDSVENPDGEDKLGQAMIKFSTEQQWGTIDLFWLPYFREQTFTGKNGRLSALPLVVDQEAAQYQSSAKQWHSDFALRYSHYVGDFEFALSHFSGTSRDPVLLPNNDPLNPKLIPLYATIDQTGVEVQYLYDEWILKLEAISNSGLLGHRYTAAVFGFEYTQVGICETNADLGWILEYLYDDRRNQTPLLKAAPHAFERDLFVGWRYAFNDADSSEVLAGVIYDPRTEEMFFSVEANKRLASDLKLNFEARAFQGAESFSGLKTHLLRDEDYVQLELVKYF
jgi:hypothetical protein